MNVDAATSGEEDFDDYEDVEDEKIPQIKLKKALNLQEMVENKSALFEVNLDYAEEDNDQLSYFNKEELLQCSKIECLYGGQDDDDDDEEGKVEPGKTPFEKLACQMVAVTEDGKIKKQVLKSGYGAVVPKEAYVTLHYHAYVEYGDEPYDSTWLREQPLRFRLSRGYVIEGLDVAVATMKKGELARFLIHPDLGYGKFGCPPRIPPNADLLFDVELINFEDNIVVEVFESLSMEERQNQDFSVILKAAQSEHLAGNDYFKKDQIKQAVSKYRRAEKILANCNLKNREEEIQQQKELLKLYVNLGVCYNKLKRSGQACNACKAALAIDPKNSKALFNFGRALLVLSEYREAKRYLLQAQKLEPSNPEITEELKKLNKKQKTYSTEVKSFSQRAFKSNLSPEKETTEKAEVSEKFEKEVIALITEFMENDEKNQMSLPSHLTAQEELCIKQKAQEKGLNVRAHEQNGEMMLFLLKPEQ